MNERDKEFEESEEMFATTGWKRFIQNTEDYEKMIKDSLVDNAVTNDQWQYARGQLHQLRSFIKYEDFTRTIHEQKEFDNADTV